MMNNYPQKRFSGIVEGLTLSMIAGQMQATKPDDSRIADALLAVAALSGGAALESVAPVLLQAASELISRLDILHSLKSRDQESASKLAAAVIERLNSILRMRKVKPGEPLPEYYRRREDVCLALLVIAYQRYGEFDLPEDFERREEFCSTIGEGGLFANAVIALGLGSKSASGDSIAA